MIENVTVTDHELRTWLVGTHRRIRDPRPVFRSGWAYMDRQTHRTFEMLAHGGTFRGVTWAGFADQYTRKTDGVPVPAWGGVRRIRAGMSTRSAKGRRLRTGVAQDIRTRRFVGGKATTGPVRGKLRPSGKRITPNSHLMVDTGRMRKGATGNARISRKRLLIFVPNGVGYARFQQAMRPFLFFTPADADYLAQLAADYVAAGGSGSVTRHLAEVGSMLDRLRELGSG